MIKQIEKIMLAGILLAAGESKRFKPENKLLYKINNVPVLEHLLRAFLQSQIDSITIVVGYQKTEVIKLTRSLDVSSNIPINFVENQDFHAGGMSSSIIKGMQSVINSEAVLITPADIPFIPSNVLNTLINYFKLNKPKIIIPCCDQRTGHPILISSDLFPEVLAISEETRGLKEITTRFRNQIVYLPVEAKGIIRDIDTKEDLRKFT
ncbi:MAG: nucleotidyltransferase family protein [Candidatus Heimdallarchaeota archaeon]|nr:nucleotidyltransferase family protein [Candidatus Heimdallarchaeota archaeon]